MSASELGLLGGGGAADVRGGINYAFVRTTWDADDAVVMAYTAVQDYYIVGLANYLADTTVADIENAWGLFKHGQPASPIFLVGIVGPTLPVEVPSFEAKFMKVLASSDCYIRFEGSSRAQHFVPAGVWTSFNRRCNIFFVQRVAVDGNLVVQMYG